MRALGKLALTSAVFGLVVAFAGIAGAGPESGPPPPPAWVDEDGTGTEEDLPEKMPIVDSSGEVVGYADTEDLAGNADKRPSHASEASERRRVPVRNEDGEVVGFVTEDGYVQKGGRAAGQ